VENCSSSACDLLNDLREQVTALCETNHSLFESNNELHRLHEVELGSLKENILDLQMDNGAKQSSIDVLQERVEDAEREARAAKDAMTTCETLRAIDARDYRAWRAEQAAQIEYFRNQRDTLCYQVADYRQGDLLSQVEALQSRNADLERIKDSQNGIIGQLRDKNAESLTKLRVLREERAPHDVVPVVTDRKERGRLLVEIRELRDSRKEIIGKFVSTIERLVLRQPLKHMAYSDSRAVTMWHCRWCHAWFESKAAGLEEYRHTKSCPWTRIAPVLRLAKMQAHAPRR
jgi:chromosome segregation ATPase